MGSSDEVKENVSSLTSVRLPRVLPLSDTGFKTTKVGTNTLVKRVGQRCGIYFACVRARRTRVGA